MKPKILTALLSLLILISAVACGNESTEKENGQTISPSEVISTPETTQESATNPAESNKTTSSPESTSTAEQKTDNTTNPNDKNNTSNPSQPPQTSQPQQTTPSNPPTTSTPSTTSQPPATSTPTNPPAPMFSQAEYDSIIKAVNDYAKTKTSMSFNYKESLKDRVTYNADGSPSHEKSSVGWHGTPNWTKSGKDKVISTLKYDVDLTEDMILKQISPDEKVTVDYYIIKFEYKNEIYFALIYG